MRKYRHQPGHLNAFKLQSDGDLIDLLGNLECILIKTSQHNKQLSNFNFVISTLLVAPKLAKLPFPFPIPFPIRDIHFPHPTRYTSTPPFSQRHRRHTRTSGSPLHQPFSPNQPKKPKKNYQHDRLLVNFDKLKDHEMLKFLNLNLS